MKVGDILIHKCDLKEYFVLSTNSLVTVAQHGATLFRSFRTLDVAKYFCELRSYDSAPAIPKSVAVIKRCTCGGAVTGCGHSSWCDIN